VRFFMKDLFMNTRLMIIVLWLFFLLVSQLNILVYASDNKVTSGPSLSITTKNTKKQQYLHGIDVSHYQGTINWLDVEETNVHYVMVKATGGETYADPLFNRNWRHLTKVNLIRGAYHFFFAADDPIAQAQHYYHVVGQLTHRDLPPIVDVEEVDDVSAGVLLESLLTYLSEIEKLTKRTPIIYTNQAFGQQYLQDERLNKYPLWIADYEPELTILPSPWRNQGWHFWQYSEQGKVLGITSDVDLNRYQGSYEQLKLFIAQSAH
jgi:lysozyme